MSASIATLLAEVEQFCIGMSLPFDASVVTVDELSEKLLDTWLLLTRVFKGEVASFTGKFILFCFSERQFRFLPVDWLVFDELGGGGRSSCACA